MKSSSIALAVTPDESVVDTGRRQRSGRVDMELDVVARLLFAGRRWRARLNEAMRDHQQTDARWAALNTLAEAPDGLIQSELAERLGVKGPSLVKLLDALEGQGLASRRMAAGDRRANEIVLEAKGRDVLRQIDDIASALRAGALQEFTDQQLETTRHVLTRLAARLDLA